MVDDLLNGWAGELMDESLSCRQRRLKMMMQQVISVAEKG
jgi:hypothetical protein